MAATHGAYQMVQIFKIVVVVREQETPFENSMGEVNGVLAACYTNVRRKADIVPRTVQQPNQ